MDFITPIFDCANNAVFGPIARRWRLARSLQERFRVLNNQLSTLRNKRTDIKGKIDGENPQKAPTSECSGWIQSVDDIEREVNNIQQPLDKKCLKCIPDYIARARLCRNVESLISQANTIQGNWKPEADFLIDSPQAKVQLLKDKFSLLKDHLNTLCCKRGDIKREIDHAHHQKAPTEECGGWIADVDEIERQVKEISDQHLIEEIYSPDVTVLARICENVGPVISLCEDVEKKISRVQQIHDNWKPEADFLIDSPQAKVQLLKDKFSLLNNHLTALCRRRGDIKAEIDLVNHQKAPTAECEGWIAEVDGIEKQVKEISDQHLIEEIYSPDITVLARIYENVGTVISLCQDVEKMLKRVEELQVTSKFEGGYLTNLPLPKVEKMPLSYLSAEKSTNSTLQEILQHLRDGEIQKIGIWGMAGIGKTTLLKLLNNMTEIANIFQVVVWVTVSQTWSLRKIQTEVAKRLSVDIEDKDSDSIVATKLHRKLEHKKFLLLLDDVWQEINLDKVGIPPPNKNNGSKCVLTTRELDVCKKMRTDKQIDVKALPEKEAWEMFTSIVCLDFTKFLSIQKIAQEIVKKCGGLPLALNVVGGVLREEEDDHVWRDLFDKLKLPDGSYVKDMKENVFTALKASYDHLATDADIDMKNSFLYCGLFPEDHLIDKSLLINYWRAEGFLWSNDEGHVVLGKLIKASLLEKCEDGNHVRMHDLVRDFALNLTSLRRGEESRHLVRAGMYIQDTVDIHEWEKATRISFMHSTGSYSLPEMPNCPQLTTLLLQECSAPLPENFFTHMPRLRVLDLSFSDIVSLPSSIANLEDLRALFLEGSYYLEELPAEIKALKRLEVLWVSEHKMRDPAPIEMWELTSLKCLVFKGSKEEVPSFTTMIPRGKISKLSQLEKFVFLCNGFGLDEESSGVVAKELSSLTRISSLEFDFGTVKNLIEFVENSKPWRDKSITEFKFSVGNNPRYIQINPKSQCGLCYWFNEEQGDEGSGILSSAVKDVIKRSEYLDIMSIGKVVVKLSDLGVTNISGLKECWIRSCNAFETFADEEELQANSFVNLQVLQLDVLPNLRNIFRGREISPMPKNIQLKDNFKSLQKLVVYGCPMLKQLFSSRELVLQFLNLEELVVRWCKELEEIISDNVNDEMGSSSSSSLKYWTPLPKLKDLHLADLDEFVSFFSKGNVLLRWPSLHTLEIFNCPKLETLPFRRLRRLRDLELHNLPKFYGFDDEVHYFFTWPSSLQLSIEYCPSLPSWFTKKRPTR